MGTGKLGKVSRKMVGRCTSKLEVGTFQMKSKLNELWEQGELGIFGRLHRAYKIFFSVSIV